MVMSGECPFMNRRRYLAALAGLTGLTGCASSGSQPTETTSNTRIESATATSSPTPTESPTPIAEPDVTFLNCYSVRIVGPSYTHVSFVLANSTIRDFADSYEGTNTFTEQGGTPIEQVFVFYADTSTEVLNPEVESCGESPTPTPEPGNPLLDSAYGKLIGSYEAYLSTNDGGFHDIDETVSMLESEIRGPLYEAREDLREAENDTLNSEEKARLSDLRSIYWFFWWLPAVHEPLNKAYRTAKSGWKIAVGGSFQQALTKLFEAEDHATDAGRELEKLREDSRAGSMASFEPLTPDDYHRKHDAIERALEEIRHLRPLVEDLRDMSPRLRQGVTDYFDENYGGANDEFASAARILNDFASKANETTWRPSFTMVSEDLGCMVGPLEEGTDLMIEASAAGANGNDNTRVLRQDEACTAYSECDLVTATFPSMNDLCR